VTMVWSRFVWWFVWEMTCRCSEWCREIEDENRCVNDCFRVIEDWMIEDWWVTNKCVVDVSKMIDVELFWVEESEVDDVI